MDSTFEKKKKHRSGIVRLEKPDLNPAIFSESGSDFILKTVSDLNTRIRIRNPACRKRRLQLHDAGDDDLRQRRRGDQGGGRHQRRRVRRTILMCCLRGDVICSHHGSHEHGTRCYKKRMCTFRIFCASWYTFILIREDFTFQMRRGPPPFNKR